MKTRQELIKEQEHLLEVYEKVKDMLEGYANVVQIGIGAKEKDGQLTDEGCIKIIVSEKKKEADLDSASKIPSEVEGVKTDIVVKQEKIEQPACTEDQSNHRPIIGGIMISNYRNGSGVGGTGTLGCMAQMDSDDSWVILSNHHVLYGTTGQDGDDIGQPWVGCSWCCKTNVIAKNEDKDAGLDCAIAKVNSDIAIDNSIEEIGVIDNAGAAAAVNLERVRKRGARTGFTSGTISFIDPATKEITVTPKPAGGPADDPGGCTNYEPGVTVFTYYGDSGSVYINDDNEVVGLHYAGNANASLSYGKDILQVQTTLGITIKTTSSTPGVTPSARKASYAPIQEPVAPLANDWTGYVQKRLEETATGRSMIGIFRQHENELFTLVNKHRPVTVVWQRKQGPAFLAAFGRSVKHEGYKIPKEINGVSLQNLLMSMATVLEDHASEPFKEGLKTYGLDIIRLSRKCHTAKEFFALVEEFDKEDINLSLIN